MLFTEKERVEHIMLMGKSSMIGTSFPVASLLHYCSGKIWQQPADGHVVPLGTACLPPSIILTAVA